MENFESITTTRGRILRDGDMLGPTTHVGDFDTWNRYAAVNDEFIPIHMDDSAGRAAGMPAAFGMGNLTTSWLHNLLRDWGGADAQIAAFSIRFRKPALKGPVVCTGVIGALARGNGVASASISITASNSSGDLLATGEAVVRFPAADDA